MNEQAHPKCCWRMNLHSLTGVAIYCDAIAETMINDRPLCKRHAKKHKKFINKEKPTIK